MLANLFVLRIKNNAKWSFSKKASWVSCYFSFSKIVFKAYRENKVFVKKKKRIREEERVTIFLKVEGFD